jgi:hypothetical protein
VATVVRPLVLSCLLASAGCGGDDDLLLVVDLRTELVPGVDFQRVRTEVQRPGASDVVAEFDVPADPDADYAAGARVAEAPHLSAGGYVIRVELSCDGAVAGVVEGASGCNAADAGTADAGPDGDAEPPDPDAGPPGPAAFRFVELELRDPHLWVVLGGSCIDGTEGPLGVNAQIQTDLTEDGDDPDTALDLSIVEVFRPLEQRPGMTTFTEFVYPECTSPESTTTCTLASGTERAPASPVEVRGAGVCLDVLPGTARPYTPAIAVPAAPTDGTCYVATLGDLSVNFGGAPVVLREARVAGEWPSAPATQIVDGLIRGFIAESDANFTYVPHSPDNPFACVTVSELLPGGDPPPFVAGDPQPPSPCTPRPVGEDRPANCDTENDMDTSATGEPGWYMYFNFRARVVPYAEE